MPTYTRKEFLGLGAVLAGSACAGLPGTESQDTPGDNQRMTVDEALRIATMHGARASFEERTKGSIALGKLADFVVLERDPHEVDPDTIKDIRVVRTVVGGGTVHTAAE